jgi:hypothetical protein
MLKLVLKEIAYCTNSELRPNDAEYNLLDVDKAGNLIETEGCEDLQTAMWVYLGQLFQRFRRHGTALEAAANVILRSNTRFTLPQTLESCMTPHGLLHLYMKHQSLHNAVRIVSEAASRSEYVDPVLCAQLAEALRNSDLPELRALHSRLLPIH